MHGRKVYLAITTALIAALLLLACGKHSSRVLSNVINPQAQPQQPQDDSANRPLPGVMQLDAQVGAMKSVSEDSTVTTDGWLPYYNGTVGTNGTSSDNIEQADTSLILRSFAPGEYSYALYSQPIGTDPKPMQTLIDSEVCKVGGGRDDEIPLFYYIGAADYTVGAWRWFGPFDNTGVLVMVNSDVLKSRFKSPSNNFYLCVLAANGGKAASALPKGGMVADFPIEFSAKGVSDEDDTPYGLLVKKVVTWVAENLMTEPAIVTDLSAYATTSGVELHWAENPDPDVFIYQFFRDDLDDEEPSSLLAGINAPIVEYIDTTGIPGKEYEYSVRARNNAGFGGLTTAKAIRLLATPAVTATDGGYPDKVAVSWTQVEGAVAYSVLRDGSEIYLAPDDALSYEDASAVVGTQYEYGVKAVGEDAEGPIGGPDIGFAAFLNPVEVTATDGSFPTHVSLTWGDEPLATAYNIYRDTDTDEAGAALLEQVGGDTTSYDDTTAVWASQYYYFIRPIVGGLEQARGTGDWGYRCLGKPTGVTATQGDFADKVVITWSAVNHATRYRVYRCTDENGSDPNFWEEVTAPTVHSDDTWAPGWDNDTGEGYHHFYYVVALHAGPDSEVSPPSDTAEGWRGLPIPQDVLASDGTYPYKVVVTWTQVPTATGYKVSRASTEFETPTMNWEVTEQAITYYEDTWADPATTYWYEVRAMHYGEYGLPSPRDEGIRGNAPPEIQSFTATPDEGDAPLEVSFSVIVNDPEEGDLTYDWDWENDGTWDVEGGTSSSALHTYDAGGEYTCMVRVNDDGGGMDTATVLVSVMHWKTVSVLPVNNPGWRLSLTSVNGNPAISYHNYSSAILNYVRATSEDGSSWGTPVTIDNNTQPGDRDGALAVVNGSPAIAYFDSTSGSDGLYYARATDVNGSSWSAPQAVDVTGFPGEWPSLVIVNGYPAISYFDGTNDDLKYVRAIDADGFTWGTPQVVDTGGGEVGKCTSLAIVNGYPAISYIDDTLDDLKYIRSTDANGNNWETPLVVADAGESGTYTSLVIINGYPAIAYYDNLGDNLSYVRASDSNGSSWGSPVTIDSAGTVGLYAAMAVLNGFPAISYYDDTNDDLKFVTASDLDGSSWNEPQIIDSVGVVGMYTSMAIVNGLPAISYYDYDNAEIKYAYYTTDP